MYIERHIEDVILKAHETFPSLLVTGPRQIGKSTVLKTIFPNYTQDQLDDLSLQRAIKTDPLGYLKLKGTPIIIDEIQKVPELFSSIKYVVDKEHNKGMYLLTGSQRFQLMKGVSESLAGRIAIINMQGLSLREIYADKFKESFIPTTEYLSSRNPSYKLNIKNIWEIIHKGSMPSFYDNSQTDWEMYYASYLATYVERDVRELVNVGDSLAFTQFITLLASRTGELLNMGSLANEIGVSAPTIKRWISILETSGIIYLLKPFSLNATKRVIKTPKVYFTDTGLVCYLCKWLTVDTLINGAQAGSIFETFIVNEIIKSFINKGKEPDIFFFRNTDGNEVDLIIYQSGKIYPIEIKKTSSPNIKDIKNFKYLQSTFPSIELSEGGVICTAEQLLPLGQGNKIIPLNYI